MLRIHRSERAGPLVVALAAELCAGGSDVFAPEVVAVASRGIERWLAQRLSHVLGAVEDDGVCANVSFPSSHSLLDDSAAAVSQPYAASVQRWSSERAVWPLMSIIGESARSEPWAEVLAVHLTADPGRRFAVAGKLARHFESYARSRPAMLRAWRDGRDEQGDGTPLPADLHWQAELWRRLRGELGASPAELLDVACERLRERPGEVPLPDRFSIFGTTRLSPTRIAVLDALAQNREVHLWLHHPSPALWETVRRTRPSAGRRRDESAGAGARNPLLASLSRDIKEMQQLLPAVESIHHELGHRPGTLLGRLQGELAEDRVPDAPTPIAADDASLMVHACHGPARQVEVIREVVLGLLRDDPTLEPRDVLVMCPDVETFAPLVAATFGMSDEPGGHPASQLRVRLADRALRQTNPMLGLLGQLLDLAADRVTATQLLDLAAADPVRRRFLFSDDDVERVRGWTTQANARWGLDARHRESYGLGQLSQGTWRTAIDRLLLGVAMEEDGRWLGPALPLDDVDSGDIDLAGRFAEFVDRVDTAVRAFVEAHAVSDWTALLEKTVLSLGDPQQPWQAAQLSSELDDVSETATDTDVLLTRADIATLLRDRLAGRPSRASFRTGTLTVCTLVPMRSVPHRVVCLLGMDDGAFPRHGVIDGDDVLARDPRTGERDVRSEDRQLFLDAICAAEEHLVIAYTGADPRTGAEVPPCVPLGELLDAVDATAVAHDRGSARSQIVVRHPLQPFDPRNFSLDGPGPFSFDPGGLAGARAVTGERAAPRNLVVAELDPTSTIGDVDLDDLVKFVVHPMREFLKQRLLLSTWRDDHDLDDALPVDIGGLPAWAIGSRLLRNRLAGMSVDTCAAIEDRRGDLPPGQLGHRALADIGTGVEAVLAACATERATDPRSVDIGVRLGGGRTLSGTVRGLRGSTMLDVTYSSLGAKQRLESWVRYLALVAQLDDPSLRAVTVGRSSGGATRRSVHGVATDEARGVLDDLIALRDDGMRSPLPLPVKTTAAYAERRFDNRSVEDAEKAAATRWQDGQYPGEASEDVHQLILGGKVPLTTLLGFAASGRHELRFDPLAVRLWTPLLSAEAP